MVNEKVNERETKTTEVVERFSWGIGDSSTHLNPPLRLSWFPLELQAHRRTKPCCPPFWKEEGRTTDQSFRPDLPSLTET